MTGFSITTKKGDAGETGLLDNSRVLKVDPRPEAYGTLDEASSFLGLARATTEWVECKQWLLLMQNHIFVINSELACPVASIHLLKSVLRKDDLEALERISIDIENRLNLPRRFVIYGETRVSAILDIARAVVRRAERRIIALDLVEKLANPHILPYVNRLSDVLYLLARYEEFAHQVPYRHPNPD